MAENTKYWSYHPEEISGVDYEAFYDKMLSLTNATFGTFMGKTYEQPRRSCVFSDEDTVLKIKSGSNFRPLGENGSLLKQGTKQFSYLKIRSFTWAKSSVIRKIKAKIEKLTDETYDYCLVNIYRDGKDYIPWHNDKEALTTPVVSVSLGCKRKFRLRKIDAKNGYDHEYSLGNGDVFFMKTGCQSHYKHFVPKELKITDSRINLTFRKLAT